MTARRQSPSTARRLPVGPAPSDGTSSHSSLGFYYVCLDLSPPLEIEENTPPPSPRLSRGPFSSLIPDWAQAPHRDTRPRSTFGYVDSKEDSADEDESHESRSTSPASTARHESLLRAQRLQDLSYAAVVAGVSPPLVASHQHGDATPKEDVSTTVLPIQEWPPPPPSPRLARSVLPVPPISPSPSLQGTGLKTPREKAPKRVNPAWSRATVRRICLTRPRTDPSLELDERLLLPRQLGALPGAVASIRAGPRERVICLPMIPRYILSPFVHHVPALFIPRSTVHERRSERAGECVPGQQMRNERASDLQGGTKFVVSGHQFCSRASMSR